MCGLCRQGSLVARLELIWISRGGAREHGNRRVTIGAAGSFLLGLGIGDQFLNDSIFRTEGVLTNVRIVLLCTVQKERNVSNEVYNGNLFHNDFNNIYFYII